MSVSAAQNYISRSDGATWAGKTYNPTGVNPTVGNLLVLCFYTFSTSAISTCTGITNGAGASWTLGKSVVSGDTRFYVFYRVCTNATDDNTMTAALTGTPLTTNGMFAEYTATGTPTWAVDGTATSATGSGTAIAPGSITTAGSSGVIIGYANTESAVTPTPATNWTRQNSTGAVYAAAVEDRFVTAAGTYAPDWTATSGVWQAIGIAFRSDGGAGATIYHRLPLLGVG